ncbi:mitochondrial dicarboxylate carrier-like, partial [Diaphorina citri]|uniref:Mitochondrial dicarboxylate carrier-like n=1 Tax=Diaphorina citri TaxID=121845 RepID=A0A1S3D087_DIACI
KTTGGLVGTPADMVNVRMQNDVKLPPEQRRNYKHAIDGMIRVYKEEGFKRLYVKLGLLSTPYFEDNATTHFLSSLTAGAIATTMTQPLDVLKTRAMNATPGQFNSMWALVTYTAKLGPAGFFKVSCISYRRAG